MELSILIPALNEKDNIVRLIPELRRAIPWDVGEYEIVVVDNYSTGGTAEVAGNLAAIVVQQTEPGYGGALRTGFGHARGRYVLTLDADLSHPPHLLTAMWEARDRAEVVVASRYVPGGASITGLWRKSLSRVLNVVFSRGLSLPVRDVSSGYWLYDASVLYSLSLQSTHFDVLEEVLIQIHARGYRIVEVPFCYRPRQGGKSHASLLRFGWAYLRTFLRMWRLRNSIDSADYDYRAFYSVMPLQRYWQRKRHQIITQLAHGAGFTLDVGCGSSRILLDIDDVIGLDVQLAKMRHMRRHGVRVAVGSVFALPFPSGVFDCLVCSHIRKIMKASERETNDYMVRIAFETILQSPFEYFERGLRHAINFISGPATLLNWGVRLGLPPESQLEVSINLAQRRYGYVIYNLALRGLSLFIFGFLFVIGFVKSWQTSRETHIVSMFFLLSILYTMFAVSLILGQDRYRLQLHGIIWIYVSYSLIYLHSLWKAKRGLGVRP